MSRSRRLHILFLMFLLAASAAPMPVLAQTGLPPGVPSLHGTLAAPANDQCGGAEVIPPSGPFPHLSLVTNITDATMAGDPPAPSCQSYISRSVWYAFRPAVTGTYTLSTCGGATTMDDNILALYTSSGGCGGPMTQLAGGCNDDGCGTGSFRASLTRTLSQDTTYYIVVWKYGPGLPQTGRADLQLTVTKNDPPANDQCAGALALQLDRPHAGTTAWAGNQYQLSGAGCFTGLQQIASPAAGNDVVYTFTAPTSDTYAFRVSHYAATSDLVMYVADACPAGPAPTLVTSCLAAANRGAQNTAEAVVSLALAANQQVYVIVDEHAPSAGSSFVVEVSAARLESEPNNAPGAANALVQGLVHSINPNNDVDFIALGTHPAGSRVFAVVDGAAGSTTDLDMRVTTQTDVLEYDDANNDTPFGAASPNIAGRALTGVPAFLRVNAYSSGDVTEPHRVYAVVQPPFAAAAGESEPNNAHAAASQSIGNYFYGTLGGAAPSTDVDWYGFMAQAGDLVHVALDGDPLRDATPLNAAIALTDHTGATLIAVNDGDATSVTTSGAGTLDAVSPRSPGEAIVWRAQTGGIYYVRVSAGNQGTTATTGDYLLSVAKNGTPGGGGLPADIAVSITGADSVVSSFPTTHTITVTNNSTSPALNVTVTDSLGAGTTFQSLTSTGSCTTPTVGTTGMISCTYPLIAPGSSVTLSVQVLVTAPMGNTITHAARAWATQPDLVPLNNTATRSAFVALEAANLTISTQTAQDSVFAGGVWTRVVTVTNLGQGTAQNVSVRDSVASGSVFESISVPVGWTATTPASGNAGPIVIGTTALAANASASFTITTRLLPTIPHFAAVQQCPTISSTTLDPDTADNRSCSSVTALNVPSASSVICGTGTSDYGSRVDWTMQHPWCSSVPTTVSVFADRNDGNGDVAMHDTTFTSQGSTASANGMSEIFIGPGITVNWRVNRQWNQSGVCQGNDDYTCVETTQAMKTPSPVFASTAASDRFISIGWAKKTDHPDDLHRYIVYSNGVALDTLPGTARSYTYAGQPLETAVFGVATLSGLPVAAPLSSITTETGSTRTFDVPANVFATDDAHVGQIRVRWVNTSDYATHLRLYRDSLLIATLPTGTTEYRDLDVEDNRTYSYTLRAFHAPTLDSSALSVADAGRAHPILTSASDGSLPTRVAISWNPLSLVADQVKIYRDGQEIGLVNTLSNVFFDDHPVPGRLHRYGVSAIKDSMQFRAVTDDGFMPANGRIEGKVQTPTLAGIADVDISVHPVVDTVRRALAFTAPGAVVDGMRPFDTTLANTFTMEMWVRPGATRPGTPQSVTGTAGAGGQRYAIAPVNGEDAYGAGHAGTGVSIGTNGISVFEHADGHFPSTLVHDASIPGTVWTHVAVVYQNRLPSLYINGTLAATGVTSTRTVHPSALFGDVQAAGSYVGLLDDVRIWNHARTAAQIAADTNRQLRGDEDGLVGYWTFNNTTSASDMVADHTKNGGRHGVVRGASFTNEHPDLRPRAATKADGSYIVHGVYYDRQSNVVVTPRKDPHGFDPGMKTRKLDVINPTDRNVDFIDTTAFSVEGFVHFPPLPGRTDSCGVANVEIWVNGRFHGVYTDSTGRFNLSVDEAGTYTITPKLADHTFLPASITRAVDYHIAGAEALRFRDTKTRTLSVRTRGGSRTCDIPIGPAQVTIDAYGTDPQAATACVTIVDTTDIDGALLLQLPAQRYGMTVRYLNAGIPDGPGKEEHRMWDMTRDSVALAINTAVTPPDTLREWSEALQHFNYHAPARLLVRPFWESCGPHDVVAQSHQYQVVIDVIETIPHRDLGAVDCPVDSGIVHVYDEISDDAPPVVTMQVRNGRAHLDTASAYLLRVGAPNVTAHPTTPSLSYKKRFQAGVINHVYSEQTGAPIWLLVTGSKSRTPGFRTTSPELPLMIVRRPPGDQSAVSIDGGGALSYSALASYQRDTAPGTFTSLRCGAAGTLPFAGKPGEDTHALNVFSGSARQLDQYTMATTWTAGTTFSTATPLVGVAGRGDVVMGGALDLVYTLSDIVDLSPTCQVIRDTSLGWGTRGFATTYTYTTDHIRDVLIPQLITVRDVLSAGPPASQDSARLLQHSIAVWQQVLAKNEALKQAAEFQRSIQFAAGGSYSNASTITSDTSVVWEWTGHLPSDIAEAVGARSGAFNTVAGGVAVPFRLAWGGSFSQARDQRVAYMLNDDDAGDRFTVGLSDDHVYGTPVFSLQAGLTSCPWEPGSQSRDAAPDGGSQVPRPALAMDRYLVVDILPEEHATFTISMTNTSSSGETRDYTLAVRQTSNLDGAIILVDGTNIASGMTFTIPPGVTRRATMTVHRGPVAYDYDDLVLTLTSACDAQIEDTKTFGVHFLSPCSNASLLAPIDNFLISQVDGDVMRLSITDLEKTKIGEIEAQYKKVGSGKWNTAVKIPINSLLDHKFLVFDTTWVIPPTVTDGQYDIRIKISCASVVGDGVTYSNIVTGTINRTSLQVHGVPSPLDGILNFGDRIEAVFSSDLDCGALTTKNVSLMFLDDSTFIPSDSIRLDCNGNTLVIIPTVATRSMQNRRIECIVREINDVNGNYLEAPLVWRFRVNMNSLVWVTPNASVTTYQGSSASVTGTLRNLGSRMETYVLSPHSAWLSTSTYAGTVTPSGEETVTFIASDKLAPGRHLDTIHANTIDGDEPFYIEVNVLNRPPAWTVQPSSFQHTMEVTCNVLFDTSLSMDQNDIVAAFVGTQCRGVANIQHVPSLDVYRAFLTVYGDGRAQETVTFRVWKASSGRITLMQETFPFDPTASHGTLVNPVILHPASSLQVVPLDKGWTWFSLNTKAANMSPNAVFARTNVLHDDVLKSQTKYAQYVSGRGWLGSLDTLRVGQAYKVKLAQAGTIELTGVLQPPTLPIAIAPGWNWIGYMPVKLSPVSSALASLLSSTGDRLVGRDAFALYDNANGWNGSLVTMDPNRGYLLKSALAGTLVYPDLGSLWPGRTASIQQHASFTAATTPPWQVTPALFEHSMNITGKLMVNGRRSTDPGTVIGVFAGEECRGMATPIDIDGALTYFLTAHATSGSEQLTVRAYVPWLDSVLTAREVVPFQIDGVVGSPLEPFPITIGTDVTGIEGTSPATLALEQNHPNPFNPTTTIRFTLPQAMQVRLTLHDLLGRELAVLVDEHRMAGDHAVVFDASAHQSGQYIYRLATDRTVLTRTMHLIK